MVKTVAGSEWGEGDMKGSANDPGQDRTRVSHVAYECPSVRGTVGLASGFLSCCQHHLLVAKVSLLSTSETWKLPDTVHTCSV